jgi:hypothetical protein
MFVPSVIIIALIPIAALFLLPHFSMPVEQRKKSIQLIIFVGFVWCISFYLVSTFGLGTGGKSVVFFFGLPALLTYVVFFRQTNSSVSAQTQTTEKNGTSSLP